MLDLYSLNTNLMDLQYHIGTANVRLGEKREELDRLKKALSNLKSNQSDFTGNNGICLKPEFTPQTLLGTNANKLDDFKENGLQVSFDAIPNEQISDAIGRISDQIDMLQQEIAVTENNISSMKTRHEHLMVQKQEVKNQS